MFVNKKKFEQITLFDICFHQLMGNAVVPLSKDVGYSRTFKHENAKDIFLSPADG